MKILVVDDSKAMRMIVTRTLRQAGFGDSDISEAENGALALEAITADQPDLVLSDWNMPEMTGIELLQALRGHGNNVEFGFVTSESTPTMKATALESGARFLIVKPFTPESFAAELSAVAR
jgi:two-component system, chemotaxis family, chemotaxis protein CheY